MSVENFTGKAEHYVKGRPSYPKAAIEYICSIVSKDAVFADIGAGTGKFTVKLAERGYTMFAVEPNTDMLNQLSITLTQFQNVKIINSTAESTMIPEHSIDVISVAHALHWFNIDTFLAECRRIIKPGGLVIVLYNLSPSGEKMHFSRPVIDAFFIKPTIMDFYNPMDYTRDEWLSYIATQDGSPLPTDPEYDAHIAKINAGFDRDSVDGLLHYDRVTRVYSEILE